LVNAEAVTDTPAGAQAWRIRYISSDDRGRPVEVTGMVLAPREAIPAQPRPVLAWTHGTWGIAENCAPSLSASFYKSTPAVAAVQRGYVVVAPDYQGLGSPETHPFLVGPAAARNTLDAVRAARGIPGASAGQRYAVWGESQGGHAALWTGQEARRYAPELQLQGVAAAVPPTDLIRNMRESKDQNLRAFFLAYIIDSWSKYYGIPTDRLVRPLAQRTIRKLAQRCIVLDSRPKLATLIGIVTLRQALKPVDLGTLQPWARHAAANSVPARSPGVPVFIATSDGDALVNAAVVTDYARRFCKAGGGRLRFVRLAKADHPGTARETAVQTLDWIDARFAGRPAPSDCGKF
jgi:acetyl esterase/lipase